MHSLIVADDLAARLGSVRVVDATLLDPSLGRDARAEFERAHIPGAVFLDLASLRDTADPLPNTMPGATDFADRLSALGIGRDDPIVLYDASPWRSAARAWFMLRRFGAHDAAILDGGWTAWRAGGHPVESGARTPSPARFDPVECAGDLRTLDAVRTALSTGAEQVIDARSATRFSGSEPDPHGAAAGHMPGALNVPYAGLFDADGRWKRGDALARAFADAGVYLDRPIVATCGSGITAAVLLFGLHLLGRDGALYDGSWSEWGKRADTPKTTGKTAD